METGDETFIINDQAWKGIQVMLSELKRLKEKGGGDKAEIDSFRSRLKDEIFNFRDAMDLARLHADHPHAFGSYLHKQLGGVLKVMGDLYGQVPVKDLYVLPDAPAHRPYYYAWQELLDFPDKMHALFGKSLPHAVILPAKFQAIVRYEFCEDFLPIADAFRARGANEQLVTTLMYPFLEIQSESSWLVHRELVSLRRLKAGILKYAALLTKQNIEELLHEVLYRYNVNTLESFQYFRAHLRAAFNGAGTVAAKREVLARYEKNLRQVMMEYNITFAPWLDPLAQRMVAIVEYKYKYLAVQEVESAHVAAATTPAETTGADTLQSSPGHTEPVDWLKSHQVCKMLKIAPSTLQAMRDNGSLPFTKIGNVIYYDPADVRRMLERKTQPRARDQRRS